MRDSLVSANTVQYAGTFNSIKFLRATQDYMRSLLSFCNNTKEGIILIDQLVPPTCVERYSRYLPPEQELRVFIVDRDPRDLYITCKYFLRSHAIPCNNVNDFCNWYKWTRGQSKIEKDSNTVMRVSFEDMIYEYEETRNKIVSFCGLDDTLCSLKGKIFKPELSINNTQVWKRYKDSVAEAETIKKLLPEYCYDFDSKGVQPDFNNGRMFDC